MKIRPHQNTENGYSMRVSKKLPKGAANLAYVYNEALSPERNLSVEHEWQKIIENIKKEENTVEYVVFPDNDSKLVGQDGTSVFESENVLVTDEYDLSGKKALYWKGTSRGLFDARNTLVSVYKKGMDTGSEKRRFEEMPVDEREELIYFGDKIEVVNFDGTAIEADKSFKIKLVKEGTAPFSYRIQVFTSFTSSKESSFLLKYKRYDNVKSVEVTETLNVERIFEQVSKSEVDGLVTEAEKMEKKYAVVKNLSGGYEVYAKAPMLIVSEESRPAHLFSYQVSAELKTKLSEENPGDLNIGYMFINDTESGNGVYELSSVGKKLLSTSNDAMPSFIKRENIHTEFENNGQESVDYWLADIDMPESHYIDYDVLIVSGYGDFDMSRYRQRFQRFVERGGTLVIDNNGVGTSALNFEIDGQQTFLLNMGFGDEMTPSPKRYPASVVSGRYFNLTKPNEVGQVNATWVFGEGESSSDWAPILDYTSGELGVGWKSFGNGRIVWSSVGLMRACLFSSTETTKLLSNLLLWMAEERHVVSPKRKEFIHHRNSLFRNEYKDASGNILYYDGRSDDDVTQVVAKRLLAPKVSDMLIPYVPKGFEKAKGIYRVLVENDGRYPIRNADFEEANSEGTVTWNATGNLLPGWQGHIFSGDGVFTHEVAKKKQGARSLSLTSVSGQAFIQQDLGIVSAGTYEFSAWLMTSNVGGVGAKIGLYKPTGELVMASESLSGTSTWAERKVRVSLAEDTALHLRIGYLGGNGSGKMYVDQVEAEYVGSVSMTRDGDGSERLYAYATLSRGKGLDFQNLGFDTEDVVIHHPEVTGYVKATAYVYQWNNELLMAQPVRGQSVLHKVSLRKDMGRVVIGKIATLLPPTGEGAMWADKNKIYYEFEVGASYEQGMDKKYIDIEIYDPSRRKSFYSKDGRTVISHYDLFGEVGSAEAVLEAWTSYYTLQATKKQFSLKAGEDTGIEVELPGTDDVRERWYLRVKNGGFRKGAWTVSDIETLEQLGRNDASERILGEMVYAIPSYEEQAFYPEFGVMARTEVAQFLNTKTLQVDRVPMVIKERDVVLEELEAVDSQRKTFQAELGKWNRKKGVGVYLDEFMNGTNVKIESGFVIDYERGRIIFESPVTGIIRASYSQDNFKVSIRRYSNEQKRKVALKTSDRKRWSSIEENWMSSPAPVLYKGVVSPENIIDASTYEIDYKAGEVIFKEVQPLRIYADYGYFVEEELEVEDVDMRAGMIRTKKELSFKDEVYVDYLYEENYVDYKGYYDDESNRFVHLDLNPSSGHTFTVRREEDGTGVYEEAETERLLNKEIFLYLLPSRVEFTGGREVEETEPLRHALSEKEWQHVKKARPEAMLLARVQVRENTTVDNTVVMDARRRGGGLKESISKDDIERRGATTDAFWDMGGYDGIAYYEKGVVIIKVPKEVLTVNGGRFSEEEVREKVKRHMAYGIYPIIEFI